MFAIETGAVRVAYTSVISSTKVVGSNPTDPPAGRETLNRVRAEMAKHVADWGWLQISTSASRSLRI
jgi:hypothetical protein